MTSAPSPRPLQAALVRYLPPVGDRRFWITQALVMAVFATHALLHLGTNQYPDAFATIAYAFPVVYAALEFGFRGSVATTALVVVLSVPYVVQDALSGDHVDFVGHLIELGILAIVAPVVGSVVESERLARRGHEAAERRYRALFESSGVPAVVLDESGRIQEANPAAASLLRGPLEGRSLTDVLGGDAVSALLGDRPPERLHVVAGLDLRPVVSRQERASGQELTQVVFQDVTEEATGQRQARAWALAVLSAQEDERRRIAQDLHDEALQLIVELRRRVDRAARAAPERRDELSGARLLADQAIEELRSVAVRLRPPDLDDLGLVASLERLVEDADRYGIDATLRVEGSAEPLAPSTALALYRVGQEALTNAEHHARANNVTLRVAFDPGLVRLTIADDGVGFDVERVQAPGEDIHLGLVGMRERMELIGGELSIRSAPGRGTTVAAAAPH